MLELTKLDADLEQAERELREMDRWMMDNLPVEYWPDLPEEI